MKPQQSEIYCTIAQYLGNNLSLSLGIISVTTT